MPSEPHRPDNNGNMKQLKFFLFLCLAVSMFLNVASDDDSSTGRNLADLGMLFSFLTLVLIAALIARTFCAGSGDPELAVLDTQELANAIERLKDGYGLRDVK